MNKLIQNSFPIHDIITQNASKYFVLDCKMYLIQNIFLKESLNN